jgi:ATP-dependent DNA helicase RecG
MSDTVHDLATDAHHTVGRIYPIYSECLGITGDWFAKKMWGLLPYIHEHIHEYLPQAFLDRYELVDVPTMFRQLHFPSTMEDVTKAQERLYFDKLLRLQLYGLMHKRSYNADKPAHIYTADDEHPDYEIIKTFLATLPFQLTNAQKRVIKEMLEDLYTPDETTDNTTRITMMRLLQ